MNVHPPTKPNQGTIVGLMWEATLNLITAIRTVAIVIFGYGVGWSMAEFDTQVPPLSSCEAVFRQSDLARRLGEEFGPAFITPPVLCGGELILVAPPPPDPAPDSPD